MLIFDCLMKYCNCNKTYIYCVLSLLHRKTDVSISSIFKNEYEMNFNVVKIAIIKILSNFY